MIRRLYVDNYKSLVDFTWEPGPETLVLGYNGSGKTTALDAIDVIRRWVLGDRLSDILTAEHTTRWLTKSTIRFELDLELAKDFYRFQVEFALDPRSGNFSLTEEKLFVGDQPIFDRIYAQVSTFIGGIPGTTIPFPLEQSAMALAFTVDDLAVLKEFRQALAQMLVVRPMPPLMRGNAAHHESHASRSLENFVAWYWGLAQGSKFLYQLVELLKEVWPEFEQIRFEPYGKGLELYVGFKANDSISMRFSELSEGEKMLLVLYTILAYQRVQPATSIIIDEPDNFVALAELQPWLMKLLDERSEDGQVILVSHNPEIIEAMGHRRVALFERSGYESATRVRSLNPDSSGLSLSERMARGWLNDSAHPEADVA